jgi:hypothetical protein
MLGRYFDFFNNNWTFQVFKKSNQIKESLAPIISKTSKNSPSFMEEIWFLKLLFEFFSKKKNENENYI